MKASRMYSGATFSTPLTHIGRSYVLPQHYLFQLAEQPPNDLPALLNIFRSVPPVIKRRANELFDEIRKGRSEGVDIDGPRVTVNDSRQPDDTEPVESIAQGDSRSRFGAVA